MIEVSQPLTVEVAIESAHQTTVTNRTEAG
jgi:hypothetical protein